MKEKEPENPSLNNLKQTLFQKEKISYIQRKKKIKIKLDGLENYIEYRILILIKI